MKELIGIWDRIRSQMLPCISRPLSFDLCWFASSILPLLKTRSIRCEKFHVRVIALQIRVLYMSYLCTKKFKAEQLPIRDTVHMFSSPQRQVTVAGRLCPRLISTTLRTEPYWRLSERLSGTWERFRSNNISELEKTCYKKNGGLGYEVSLGKTKGLQRQEICLSWRKLRVFFGLKER